MSVWEMLFICLRAILRGHGSARVSFDTEAQCYDVHLVSVDRAYVEDVVGDFSLVLTEDEGHRSCPQEITPDLVRRLIDAGFRRPEDREDKP